MSTTFYYGSGSPWAWRVWLALERKGIPYELKVLSFSERDTRKPEYLAINPRGKVPALVDGAFVLYESDAIAEYLEDKYPSAPALFPSTPEQKGLARRLIREINLYLWETASKIPASVFFRKPEDWDHDAINAGKDGLQHEVARLSKNLGGTWFFEEEGAVDFALYTVLAVIRRCEVKLPSLGAMNVLPDNVQAWMKRVEALPYFDKCYPPHWRQ